MNIAIAILIYLVTGFALLVIDLMRPTFYADDEPAVLWVFAWPALSIVRFLPVVDEFLFGLSYRVSTFLRNLIAKVRRFFA